MTQPSFLQLASTEDLVEELQRRSNAMVMLTLSNVEGELNKVAARCYTKYASSPFELVGLVEALRTSIYVDVTGQKPIPSASSVDH